MYFRHKSLIRLWLVYMFSHFVSFHFLDSILWITILKFWCGLITYIFLGYLFLWCHFWKTPPNPKLEKAMATHSSTLAWKILWMEEPGRLQSMGSLRVGHDWATSLSLFTFMHWRRKWQPTPVFLPGESQGRGEPGGLLYMVSHRVGHDWSDLAAAAIQSYKDLLLLYYL